MLTPKLDFGLDYYKIGSSE